MTENYNLVVRHATPDDCFAVRNLAEAVSAANLRASGVSDDALAQKGFLLYPLEAEGLEPNYRERIEIADHFWVAEIDGKISAFLMGYSFKIMKMIGKKTDNDKHIISYFLDECGFDDEVIYLQQGASYPESRSLHPMPAIIDAMFKNAASAPAAIAEIAQSPLKNEASTKFAERMGLRLVSRRVKDMDVPGKTPRISGTFMRTIPSTQ